MKNIILIFCTFLLFISCRKNEEVADSSCYEEINICNVISNSCVSDCDENINYKFYHSTDLNIKPNGDKSIASDSKGVIWLGTNENGLYKFENGEWTIFDESNSIIEASDFYHIDKIVVDKFDRLWVINNGIKYYEGQEWKTLLTDYGYTDIDITEDTLYLTDGSEGISKYNITSLDFIEKITYSDGLYIPHITFTANGEIWGHNNGENGIYQYKNKEWINYHTLNSNLYENTIHDLKAAPNGTIWGISDGFIFQIKNKKIISLNNELDLFSSIFINNENEVWIVKNTSIEVYNDNGDLLKTIHHYHPVGLGDMTINKKDNTVWVSCVEEALFTYNLQSQL